MRKKGSILIEVLVSCTIFFLAIATISSGFYIVNARTNLEFQEMNCRNIAYTIHEFYVQESDSWLKNYLSTASSSVTKADIQNSTIYYDSHFLLSKEEDQYELVYQNSDDRLSLDFYVTETKQEILTDICIGEGYEEA